MSQYHSFKTSGQQFDVYNRYTLIRQIGHGAYGVVISAEDSESNQKVAIKKIPRAFNDIVDAKRILREIKLMKKFVHENVIRILDLMPPPPTVEEFEDIYIVQDLMETDLHRIIYSRQPLSIDHIQYFIYQLLRGLKYIHSANVLHRDLKPSNILLNSNCDLKICDFGLARGLEFDQPGELTEYVVTRWYRAPEIMLACQDYTKAIDVWSAGCIFAELLARTPLFPGEDYIAQLRLICDKLGRPSEKDLDFVTSERAKRFMLSLPQNSMKPLSTLFPGHADDHQAIDLVLKMLIFHPTQRISIDAALEHPFLASLHNPEDEPVANFTFTFDFEHEELTRERIQELIWDEMRSYHPNINPQYPSSSTAASRRKSGQASTQGNGGQQQQQQVPSGSKQTSSQPQHHSTTATGSNNSSQSHNNNNSVAESKVESKNGDHEIDNELLSKRTKNDEK